MVEVTKMKRNRKLYGAYLWRVLFAGILLALTCLRVSGIEIPVVSSGELPYWDLVLRMAGHTGVIQAAKVNYIVSFGYCLPFALLIRGGMSLLTVYKGSILLNGCLWVLLYGITIYILEKNGFFGKEDKKKEAALSLVFLLPVFVSQAFLMGPQILLGIFTFLSLYWCSSEKKKLSRKRGIGYCLFGWLGIFFTPIFLGVLLGIFLYKLLEKRERKDDLKWIFLFLFGLLLLEAAEQIVLICLQTSDNQWSYTGIHSLFVMVAQGRRTSGMLGLLYGLIGKGMYLVVNTFGLILLGLFSIWKEREKSTAFEKASMLVFVNTFLLVAAIDRSESQCGLPLDAILLAAALPILLKAVGTLLDGKAGIKEAVVVSLGILVLGCFSRDIWELKKDLVFDWSSSGVLALGRNFCRDIFEISILAAAVAAMIFVVIWITSAYGTAIKEEVNGRFLKLYTGFFQLVMWGILILIAGMATRYYMVDVLPYGAEKITFSYKMPGDYMKKTKRPIYGYFPEKTGNTDKFTRLLSLENQEITYVDSLGAIEKLPQKAILMTGVWEEIPEQISNQYECVYCTDQIVFWEHKDIAKKDTLSAAYLGKKVSLVRVNSSNFQYEEYGKNYMQVKGSYKAKVKLQILTSKKGKLGKVWVKTGGRTLAAKDIVGKGKTEKQELTLSFSSLEDMKNFKVAVEKKSSVYMDVEQVSIKKVGDADEKEN